MWFTVQMKRLTTLLTLLFGLISVSTAAPLRIELVDESGAPIPARISVRAAGAEVAPPETAVVLPIGDERWLYAQGTVVVDVPAGAVELRAERGLEYRRVKRQITVPASGATERIVLSRWIDMRSRGYGSGENHLHEGANRLAAMLPAEDLDFGTSLSWWNGPDAERAAPEGKDAVHTLGRDAHLAPTSVFDAEVEYDWGAVYLTGGSRPVAVASDPRRPNLPYIRDARSAGSIVHYQAGWSREVLLDALLGEVDVVNVTNNLFHMHRFLPRGRYSNLLELDGFPIYPDTPEGMYRMNTETYYRLLNLGLRLAAGAGSATGAKENPPGFNRAYVRVNKNASISDFYRAWAEGRNFVTNGPILDLRTGTGEMPGDTISLSKQGGEVTLRIAAEADMPLETLEVIVNGEVRHAFDVKGKRKLAGEARIDVRQGAWIAVRATARDDLLSDAELARYSDGSDDELLRVRPSRLRFAHTSPVYITVDGRGPAVTQSFAEAERMLAAFEQFATRTAEPALLPALLRDVETARAKLSARSKEALPR